MTSLPDPSASDHYATLGVSDRASHVEVRAAYRRLMRSVHPDVAGTDPAAAALALRANQAWAVLKDPTARANYDRQRASRTTVGGTIEGTPSWGPGGIRPVTVQHLREAAARESAYGRNRGVQRDSFSAASRRVGGIIILVGTVLLMLLLFR